MCAVVWCYTGDPDGMDDAIAPAGDAGEPAFQFTTPMPYPMLQSMFDELLPPGLQWYWRGDFFDRITDEAVDIHHRFGSELPDRPCRPCTSTRSTARPTGSGATTRPGATGTPPGPASSPASTPIPANAAKIRQWCVDYQEALHPYSMGGAYVNFIGSDEGDDRVRATYGDHYGTLAQVKAEYDPDNFFRANQNIRPAADG